jgi:ABC-2 type transport system ATP-binding protein
MPLEILIRADELRKNFGTRAAVDGVSLQVHAGEIYALVGPDGAGKTTTMRLLCGAYTADSGSIELAGIDLWRQTEQARAQIGYLPQRFSLYGDLTVLENLRFFAEVRGISPKDWEPRSKEILTFVGLREFSDRRADALSGGMKQKLGLAAALVHKPRILLLDEPTGGVDAVTRQMFWQLLIELLRDGVAVLISTPYMDEASRCNQVGFLSGGKLLLEGSPGEITQRLEGRILALYGGPKHIVEQVAGEIPQIEDVRAFGDRWHIRVKAGENGKVIPRLKSGIKKLGGTVTRVAPTTPGLEDVFIELLTRGADTDG